MSAVMDEVREAAINTLVDVAIVGMDPKRAEESSFMNLGIQSLLIKIFDNDETSRIVQDAQYRFEYHREQVRKDAAKRESYTALLEAVYAKEEDQKTIDRIWDAREEIRVALSSYGPGAAFEGLRGALLAFDDVMTLRYGNAYVRFINAREN